MKPLNTAVKRMALIAGFVWIAHGTQPASAQTNSAIYIKAIAGVVEILPHGTTNWYRAADGSQLHASDRVRARAHSSATLILLTGQGESVVRLKAMSEVEILPDTSADGPGLDLIGGILSFFHRDKPSRFRVISDGGNAGILGTEFVMAVTSVNGTEQTTLSVIDGQVYLTNAGVTLDSTNGQQAIGEPGRPPRRTAGFTANNILQWCFYYPGVLDANELPLTAAETNELAESLAAYRAGDLLVALAKYPNARQPGSDAERVYHAALVLSVGQVEEAETNLSAMSATGVVEKNQRLAAALRTLIAAVKREPRPSTINYSPRWSEAKTNQLSSEFLADSYYEQSLGGPKALDNALQLARRAAASSPDFGFARERVAELEFSFGKTDRALADLKTALQLSPRNAQALALQGFLLAAQNKTREAIASFNAALAVDSALGNAWLGRGLCRIKRGDSKAGREDLLIAAAMEPQRAALRSYLGKAFGDAGDTLRATNELRLAKQLDTNDPTAWLYSALLNEQNNRINEAVRDLEKSQELNNNRSVYRSGLLLDQDRAVRSANLARIYDEAGLTDVAVREANKAVEADYASYSAHLFLANSYDRIRNSSPVDLRYETPAFSEYLVASLLGPADGRILAQPVSQEQYTSLLERDGPGIFSSTEYSSRGAWDQYASQYGTFKNSSYAAEEEYASDPGELPNQASETHTYSFKMKQALTPRDQVFGQVLQYDQSGGYLASVYSATNINRSFHSDEKQDPDLLLGYHHEWAPGQQTLFLLSRFDDHFDFSVGRTPAILEVEPNQALPNFRPFNLNTDYRQQETIYSAELQHIWETTSQTWVAGGRVQWGDAAAQNIQTDPSLSVASLFPPRTVPATFQNLGWDFSRYNAYAYDHWRIHRTLTLIGGVSFDELTLPRNGNSPPLSPDSETLQQLSPKAGFIWTPTATATVRGAYTRSLGGFNLDQSLRLEPTELAGFVQAYRSLIPESVVGAIGGAKFETFDLAYEQTLLRHTYLALAGELLYSSVDHDAGEFLNKGFIAHASMPASLGQHLDFREWSLDAALHQIISRGFTLSADYRLSKARLMTDYPDVLALSPSFFAHSSEHQGMLQSLLLQATFNHPSGCFAQLQGRWTAQNNSAADSILAGDNFWQFDVLAGYRFPRRHAVISVGVLNLTGQNYHLNPINLYAQLPRSSTFVAKFQFGF
jgi:Tfp pilus assembly protein PilF